MKKKKISKIDQKKENANFYIREQLCSEKPTGATTEVYDKNHRALAPSHWLTLLMYVHYARVELSRLGNPRRSGSKKLHQTHAGA